MPREERYQQRNLFYLSFLILICSFTPRLPSSVCYFSMSLSVVVCLRTQLSSWSHLCLCNGWEGENKPSEQNVLLQFGGVGFHYCRYLRVDIRYIFHILQRSHAVRSIVEEIKYVDSRTSLSEVMFLLLLL